MITNFIVEFVQYLNKNNYEISANKIFRFFQMFNDNDISFSNKDDVISLMKIVFCRNRLETINLSTYFNAFFDNISLNFQLETLEKEENNAKQKYLDSKQNSIDKLSKIEKEIQEITEKIKSQNVEIKSVFTKKEIDFIKENQDKIRNIPFPEKEMKTFIEECLIQNDINKFNYTKEFISKVINEMIKNSEDALRDNDVEKFCFLKNIYDLIKKIEKLDFKKKQIIDKKIKENAKDLLNEKISIEEEIKQAEQKHREIQEELQRKMKAFTEPLVVIQKEQSIHHRKEFNGGTRAVQLINDKEVEACIEKDFKRLTEKEKTTLYSFIKSNLIHFKTKMNRNIYSTNKHKLDIQRTVQYACKTGGLPLNLWYEEKKRSKTKLVLVLDISGSCSVASEMMLSFMYLLKDVFKGGCSTYVFVNSLYDISNIMNTRDIHEALNTVRNTIPTHGVYSDYFKPLKSLWEEEKKTITSDSIVIFMGDARNNKNDKGLDFLKNISRRAKSCYWLNTEKYEQWGKADSLAFDYMKYSKMFEVLNTNDLIYFLNNLK